MYKLKVVVTYLHVLPDQHDCVMTSLIVYRIELFQEVDICFVSLINSLAVSD